MSVLWAYRPTRDNPVLNDDAVQIPGYEGIYWITPDGKVSNSRKVLKTYTISSGYQCLKLVGADGSKKSYLLHRLVATVFCLNPEGKPYVNHKDGCKDNCDSTNLEWVTNSENILHARETGLNPYNIPTLGVKKGKGSNYCNVSYDKARNKWVAAIRDGKKNYGSKRFDTEVQAALHVNWIIDHFKLDRPRNIV